MVAVCVIEFDTASSASRTSFGYGVVWNAIGLTRTPPRFFATSMIATSIPSSDVPLMTPATRIVSVLQFLLKVREQLQGLDGLQVVDIQIADPVGKLMIHGFEQL